MPYIYFMAVLSNLFVYANHPRIVSVSLFQMCIIFVFFWQEPIQRDFPYNQQEVVQYFPCCSGCFWGGCHLQQPFFASGYFIVKTKQKKGGGGWLPCARTFPHQDVLLSKKKKRWGGTGEINGYWHWSESFIDVIITCILSAQTRTLGQKWNVWVGM